MSPALSGGFLTTGKKMKVAQSCLTLCGPMNYTVHGILQVRILEWIAFLFSRGEGNQPRFPTQGSNPGLPHYRWILYQLSHKKTLILTNHWTIREIPSIKYFNKDIIVLFTHVNLIRLSSYFQL